MSKKAPKVMWVSYFDDNPPQCEHLSFFTKREAYLAAALESFTEKMGSVHRYVLWRKPAKPTRRRKKP